MADNLVAADILEIYENLASVYAQLESAGEFAAAAHVAAAIDVLEEKLEPSHRHGDDSPSHSGLSIFVRRMSDVFGDSAESVARRQLGAACGLPLFAWASIVNQLCIS